MKNVIFVHGFLGSANNWSPVIQRLKATTLSRNHEFFALNLKGHNFKTPFESMDGSFEGQIFDDFVAQVDMLPHRQNIFVCHSYGLRPVLHFLSQRSEGRDVLVVEDASPEISVRSYEQLKEILNFPLKSFVNRREAKAALKKKFAQNDQLVQFLLSHIRLDKITKTYTWDVDRSALGELLEEIKGKALWSQWQALTGEVFLIYGDKSPVLTAQVWEGLCLRSPRSFGPDKSYRVSDAGHWVHHDQALVFIDIIAKILSSL